MSFSYASLNKYFILFDMKHHVQIEKYCKAEYVQRRVRFVNVQ